MTDDTLLPLSFPAVGRKKIPAAIDGGRITSDRGVMLLAAAERRLQLADRLAAAIDDPRDPERVTHAMADSLRARIFAIACGYEGCQRSRPSTSSGDCDPASCGRLPTAGLICAR
ncbi:transposase, partial [Mesorhizobium sp. M0678]|uniref:transposase n=1 Tax=Mesorhizobium sp. M0678 TaxID=2956985 RepID=UPI00333A5B20